MGYQGTISGSPPTPISMIPHHVAERVPAAARTIVDAAVDYMTDIVKANTPISHPMPVSGYEHVPGGDGVHLRDEIHRTEVTEEDGIYHAETGSDKDYAPYVEEGTGLYGPEHRKYLIVPHKPEGVLAWPGADGKMHFAKRVWHPGSPGQHMFLIGGSMTEASMLELSVRGEVVLAE